MNKFFIMLISLFCVSCSDGGGKIASAAEENGAFSIPAHERIKQISPRPKPEQYALFTVFNELIPEEDGGTALGEFSAANEGIDFFVKDGELYFSVSNMNLLKVDAEAGVPKLSQVLFFPFDTSVATYMQEVLNEFRVTDLKTQGLRLACNREGTSYVDMLPVRGKDVSGLEPSFSYQLMWRHADGTEKPVDCGRISPSGPGPKSYAFCDGNTLYFDDLASIDPMGKVRVNALSRCNLDTGVREPVQIPKKQTDGFINPMNIPKSVYMLYFKTTSNPDTVRIYYRKKY